MTPNALSFDRAVQNLSFHNLFLLDRDGTLNVDTDYVFDQQTVSILEGAGRAVAVFRRLGLVPVVVTNQSGIARGRGTLEQLAAVNTRVQDLLLAEAPDANIQHWLYCPHQASDQCLCRKPLTGMLKPLLDEGLRFAPEGSWIAGDKISDIQFGLNLGIPAEQCLLIRLGGLNTLDALPDGVVSFESLAAAIPYVEARVQATSS